MVIPLHFIERVSCLYRAQIADPWWSWYDEEPCPRRGLTLFVGQYAYERLGRARSYPHAAYFAVQEGQVLSAAGIWKEFLRVLDGGKPNARLNPLFHAPPGCRCVRCTFASAGGELADIVASTRSALVEGQVRQAFDRLDRVRGVGPKIAPFFLRDMAVWFGIAPTRDRELLQPVDRWVRRYVTRLAGDAVASSDSRIAQWICANSASPEAFNQGLWYFAAQIAASDVKLRRAFDDEVYARDLVERYVGQLRDAVLVWDGPGKDHGGIRWPC